MKVLFADDQPTTCMLLNIMLKRYGYTTIAAHDGCDAWEKLQADTEIQLVISDWRMPCMDGIELCRKVRSTDMGRYIYIILLSANQDEQAVIDALEAGADDFITKPFNPNELRVRLRAGERIVELEQALEHHLRQLRSAYEQIRADLQAAATAQRSLLPLAEEYDGYKFDWLFRPSSFVGGDIFNFFELGNHYIGFYQLDVAGHGVKAAMLSSTLYQQIMPAKTPQQPCILSRCFGDTKIPLPPAEVLHYLNNTFDSFAINPLDYFTIVYGYLHKPSGAVYLAQGGHPSPIRVDRNGYAKLCGNGGFPIGMLPEMEYETQALHLAPGERLFIYSDGVTECAALNEELFSEARLLEQLSATHQYSLRKVLTYLDNRLSEWRRRNDFDDDISVLAIERMV
jgi:phosphoserine phosphatase RsbU/P